MVNYKYSRKSNVVNWEFCRNTLYIHRRDKHVFFFVSELV